MIERYNGLDADFIGYNGNSKSDYERKVELSGMQTDCWQTGIYI